MDKSMLAVMSSGELSERSIHTPILSMKANFSEEKPRDTVE